MSELLGPNTRQVEAFLEELGRLTPEEFARVGRECADLREFEAAWRAAQARARERGAAWRSAAAVAARNVGGHGSLVQRVLAIAIASGFVVADLLSQEHVEALYAPVAGTVPWHRLYALYEPEDCAIEDFCEQMSAIEGGEVRVLSRGLPLHEGGASGAVVRRRGEDHALLYAPVSCCAREAGRQRLFDDFIKSMGIEEEIEARFPDSLVHIYISSRAFKDGSRAGFDEQKFMRQLIAAVSSMPPSGRGEKRRQVEIEELSAPVWVSHSRPGAGCFVVRQPPTARPTTSAELAEDMSHAVESKSGCLKRAGAEGLRTILLLDASDYPSVDEYVLAGAFSLGTARVELTGIDEVFILHGRGVACRVLPVKLGERMYPDLPEFHEFSCQRASLILS